MKCKACKHNRCSNKKECAISDAKYMKVLYCAAYMYKDRIDTYVVNIGELLYRRQFGPWFMGEVEISFSCVWLLMLKKL